MNRHKEETALSPGHPFSGERVRRIPRWSTEKRIGTWNVRSLYEAGKATNLTREMEALKVDILGCSEVRWPNTGTTVIEGHTVYYSGDNTTQNRNGVAIIVANNIVKSVRSFIPVSDRIVLLQISGKPVDLNIMQVYAPTSQSTEEEIEQFYDDVSRTMKLLRKEEVNIILGDFNAKVGQNRTENVTGEHGLGMRNDRGERLVQFCQEKEYCIMNTFFKLPPRRLYTWRGPADGKEGRLVRNQIDYIIANKRFKNSVKSAKTYPGADIPTDHNLLLATVKVRLKRIGAKRKEIRRDFNAVNIEPTRSLLKIEMTNQKSTAKIRDAETSEGKWRNIKTILKNTIENCIPEKTRQGKQSWMTEDILKLMEERKKYRNREVERYKQIHQKIKKEIKKAKETWLDKKCDEIEELEKKHDTFNLHKLIKEAAGIRRQQHHGIIEDRDGTPITDSEAQLRRWKEYVAETFEEDQREDNRETKIDTKGLPITKEEIIHAAKQLKNRKANGEDDIPAEIIKLFASQHIDDIQDMFNTIYSTGSIPQDWLTSIFVPIPKKPSSKKCEEYRTISLMSHALKLFLRVIHGRIYNKLDEHTGYTQFGFKKGLGTKEALFAVQVLIERCRDVNTSVYLCFIDFSKAFDLVNHEKLIEALAASGIEAADLRIISNLYWNQTAKVRIKNSTSENVSIKKGVRQGCILSPLLFNVYSEEIFRRALDNLTDGVIINGECLNNLRYADDTVIMSGSEEGLQRLVNRIVTVCEEYGMKLNVSKTKTMVISKNPNANVEITINGNTLERVRKVTYLGCVLNDSWDHSVEIKIRIEKARATFNKMRNVVCNLKLNLKTRLRVLRCYVFSTLLYGVETWTLTETTQRRVEAFEMWCYRRILRIPWTSHTTNIEVLNRMEKQTEVLKTVKQRKASYFGHIMRNDKYRTLQLIIEGKIEGKRGPGRRRNSWLKNLRQWTNMTSVELFRAAVDKVRWANVIANVLRG